jgi:hypothetical protein
MNVSELTNSNVIMPVLRAYQAYRTEVNQDGLSQAMEEAKLPDAQVFYNKLTKAVIIVLAERHDSDIAAVREGAEDVATHVMAIPNVKIAVEEPIWYDNKLISNVGFGHDVTTKPVERALFEFSPDSAGSISHQIYLKQVIEGAPFTTRYAAEKMPRESRYNNPNINKTMAQKLYANTGRMGEISVFPVGPDHVHNTDYDPMTLDRHLMMAGWYLLVNR